MEISCWRSPCSSTFALLRAASFCSRRCSRASLSCDSTRFVACSMTRSAARTRLAAGLLGSSIIFSRVVLAALQPCCNRAMASETASLRACRYSA